MIEIIDYMTRKAGQVSSLRNRVYRAYPQRNTDDYRPFAVINPAGRSVIQTDNEGNETLVQLSYIVTMFDRTPENVDSMFSRLTTIYNHAHIQNAGYSPSYQASNGMFTATATYTVKVDNRGMLYSR